MWAWFSSSLAKLKLDDIPWIAARVQPHSSCAKSKIDMVTLLSCRAQGISQSYAQHVHQGAWLYSYSLTFVSDLTVWKTTDRQIKDSSFWGHEL